MVKLLSHSPQAAFSVTQAFAIGSLSKSHTKKLIKACKRANTVIIVVAINATTKFFGSITKKKAQPKIIHSFDRLEKIEQFGEESNIV